MRKIKNRKTKLAILPLLVLFYSAMAALHTTCFLKSIFGIPCPGCGMTRAVLAALQLHFAEAFTLHPMFWSLPILVLYVLYDGQLWKNKIINRSVLVLLALGFLANWLARLFS